MLPCNSLPTPQPVLSNLAWDRDEASSTPARLSAELLEQLPATVPDKLLCLRGNRESPKEWGKGRGKLPKNLPKTPGFPVRGQILMLGESSLYLLLSLNP